MGSLAPDIEHTGGEREINVLVTGFGPFLENKVNPSFLIAKALPKQIALPGLPRINIHTYPQPIEVSYANVLATIPQLLFKQVKDGPSSVATPRAPPDELPITTTVLREVPRYDLTLNIGMAPSRTYYALETKAHCQGYEKKDVRNEAPNDRYWHEKYNSPTVLQPTYDPEDVWRRWKSVLVNDDVRLSSDAGRYLCDYIFYACMLEYWIREPDGERPCAFLHVPGSSQEEDILRGTKTARAAIGALVGSMVHRKREGKTAYIPDPYA